MMIEEIKILVNRETLNTRIDKIIKDQKFLFEKFEGERNNDGFKLENFNICIIAEINGDSLIVDFKVKNESYNLESASLFTMSYIGLFICFLLNYLNGNNIYLNFFLILIAFLLYPVIKIYLFFSNDKVDLGYYRGIILKLVS